MSNRHGIALVLSLIIVSWGCAPEPIRESDEAVVYIVRHTEKAVDEGDDPNLTAEGLDRAIALSHVLSGSNVTKLYASQYKRTQQTLRPLAQRSDLDIHVVDAGDVTQLVDRIRGVGGEVAVASHSNLIPEILRELGVETDLEISEDRYDDLFVVYLKKGADSRLVSLKYGLPASGSQD